MGTRAPLVAAIFLHLLAVYRGHLPPPADVPSTHYSSEKPGDFSLAALLPVHTSICLGGICRRELGQFSLLQRLEAISYAVEEINSRHDLLSGFTLGYVIYDDQDSSRTALAQGLRFVQEHCVSENSSCGPGGLGMETHQVVGVIASEESLTTLQIANLFTTFRLPQISYMASSSLLSSRRRYPYFFRTAPSDEGQAKAIIGLMRRFNWKYASVIFSAGQYGTSGYRDLLRTVDDIRRQDSGQRICFGLVREIDDMWTVRKYKDLIYELLLDSYTSTVVAFITPAHARVLFALAEGMAIEGKLTWIATDGWLNELTDLSEPAKAMVVGALSVKPKSYNPPRFYRRYRELTPANSRNPWLPDFLETYFNCTYPPRYSPRFARCNPNLNISRDPRNPREKTVSLVYDAVYAFAHGLQDALDSEECRQLVDRETKKTCAVNILPHALRQVRFPGESGEVRFDGKTLSVPRAYNIYNVQDRAGQWSLVNVGIYDIQTEGLEIELKNIQWNNGTMPSTMCNQRCGVGYGQRVMERCCCWMCEKCPKHHIVVFVTAEDRWQCTPCKKGTWPNAKRLSCDDIKPTYVRWHEPLGIIISSLASTGLAACLVIMVLYVMNNSHPLVKASSRELSYFLLACICICYIFCFCFIIKPSVAVCIIRQFGICVCSTLLYGPLVTKTSRIYRIFEAGSKNKKAHCVSSKSQLGIAVLIVLIQCAIITGFLIAIPPRPENRAEEGVHRVDQTCWSDERAYVTAFTYNGLLLLAAMYCAFKTRKLPDHFNEARFITFCVYSTIIILLAFVPAYFVVRTAFHQLLLLSLSVLANATLVLFCFFTPKLVAVYFTDCDTDDPSRGAFRIRRGHRKSHDDGQGQRSLKSRSSDVHPMRVTPREGQLEVIGEPTVPPPTEREVSARHNAATNESSLTNVGEPGHIVHSGSNVDISEPTTSTLSQDMHNEIMATEKEIIEISSTVD